MNFFGEEFWRSVADSYSSDAAEKEVSFMLQAIGVPRGHLLDMGCGEGRHAIVLADMGWNVTGVELHAPALERARAAAGKREISFLVGDMRNPPAPRERTFDIITFFQNTFGYFDDVSNFELLTMCHRRLNMGGWVYLDIANVDAEALPASRTFNAPEGNGTVCTETYNYAESRLTVSVEDQGDGNDSVRTGEFRLFRPAEVVALLRVAGFQNVKAFSDFSLTKALNRNTQYFQVIGQK